MPLTQFLIDYIFIQLKIKISHTDIIDLTSSSNFKFSRHLVIILPNNYIFRDNYQCGIFVNKLCDTIQKKAKMGRYYDDDLKDLSDIDKRLRSLFISDHLHSFEKDYVLFIDKSVYSKNRCFRLIYSSKLKYIHSHTPVTLLPFDPFICKKNASKKDKFVYFMQTIICAVNDNSNLNYIDFSSKIIDVIHFDSSSRNVPLFSPSKKRYTDYHVGDLKIEYSPYSSLDEWMKKFVLTWGHNENTKKHTQ